MYDIHFTPSGIDLTIDTIIQIPKVDKHKKDITPTADTSPAFIE